MQHGYCLILVPTYSGAMDLLIMAQPANHAEDVVGANERFIRNPGAWTEIGRMHNTQYGKGTSWAFDDIDESLIEQVEQLRFTQSETQCLYVEIDAPLHCFQSADNIEQSAVED